MWQHMVSSVMSELSYLYLEKHPLMKTSIHSSICNIFLFDMLSSGQISEDPSPKKPPYCHCTSKVVFILLSFFFFLLAAALLCSEDILLGDPLCKTNMGSVAVELRVRFMKPAHSVSPDPVLPF